MSGERPAVSVRRDERLEEEVHAAVLEDGMPVRIIPRPGWQKRFAVVTVGYGAIDVAFAPPGQEAVRELPAGIAHFLEHKLFEDEAGDVFDQFARHGASANAYTTAVETAYHFTTSTRFEECLDLLLDLVTDPFFTAEKIEKERRVIAQEIRMYADDPDAQLHLQLLRALYQRHPVREDVAGSEASIERIGREELELCHRSFYQPANMLLSVAGDVDPGAVLDQLGASLRRRAAERGAPERRPFRRALPDEPAAPGEARVERRMSVAHPKLLMGWKDEPGLMGRDALRRTLESYLLLELLFGRSSAFYEANYAAGLLDPGFAHHYTHSRGHYAHGLVGGETRDPQALIAAVEACIEAARRSGLEPDAFRRIQRKVVGAYLKGFNSSEHLAGRETDAFFEGWEVTEYLGLLESIQLADLERRSHVLLRPERRALSLVLPG